MMLANTNGLMAGDAHSGSRVCGGVFDHAATDQRLIAGALHFDAALTGAYAQNPGAHPLGATFAAYKACSMLAVETLCLMHAFALETTGAILEIGAYTGGGTLALAHGVRTAGRPAVISVDRGGRLDSKDHCTPDIAAAWHANLAAHGLQDHAHLIVGNTAEPGCGGAIRAALAGRPIGLVCIDADGFVWRHLAPVRDLIAPDCLVMLDDYGQWDALVPKKARTWKAVADGVSAGVLEPYVVVPWATWFGRMTPAFTSAFDGLLAAEQARRDREDPSDLPPAKGETSKFGFTPAS
jgi:predicted O-methyltransferase YrrM